MQATDRFVARSREDIVYTHPVTVREFLPWVRCWGLCSKDLHPPQPPFLSVSVWCAISAQRVLAGAANASYFQSSNQLRFFFNHLRNFKETSSHPEKMSNVFALLISSTQRTSSVNLSVLEPKISTGAQRGISVRIYCRQYFLKQG